MVVVNGETSKPLPVLFGVHASGLCHRSARVLGASRHCPYLMEAIQHSKLMIRIYSTDQLQVQLTDLPCWNNIFLTELAETMVPSSCKSRQWLD